MSSRPLIPREVLFGNPDFSQLQLSPDGKYVSYLAPHHGVMNIWVQEFGKPETARAVTHDKKQGYQGYHWTYAPATLLFSQDRDGDENFGIYTLNVENNELSEILPPGKSTSYISEFSHLRPNEVVIATNERDPSYFDYKVVHLQSKKQTVIFTNTEQFAAIFFDWNYNPIVASKSLNDGSSDVYLWDSASATFLRKDHVPFEDGMGTHIFACSPDGTKIYCADSRGRDTAALVEWNTTTDKSTVLAESPKSDFTMIKMHPKSGELLLGHTSYLTHEKHYFNSEFKTHIEKTVGAMISLDVISLDGQKWVVSLLAPQSPFAYYFYDTTTEKLSEPMHTRKTLVPYADSLHELTPLEIKSRDGLTLVSYFTKSRFQTDKKLILLVHGGPWHRDTYAYSPYHQWLANRGYNVLSVNFRGSTGFGKKFLNAADLQWGRTMHDDLIDAVEWAIANGHADRNKVAIMGGSYGGYATLAGLTFTPETFVAGVDIVGPSNLETLLASAPPYWASFRANLFRRVGNPETAEGRAILKERSPLNHVDKIKKPLLILQGANDPRVKKAEADQIFNAMKKKNIPVEYVLFPDEGHGFHKAKNNLASNAVIEEFLHKHLGGEFEPKGAQVEASTAQFITELQ